jgi:hypothetical protein
MIIAMDSAAEEIVEVTNRVSLALTVVRGVDGSTALAHNAGDLIAHGFTARDFDEPNGFLNGATIANQPTLLSLIEVWATSASGATGTINIDALTASVLYYTGAATAAFNINVRGSSGTALSSVLAVGESLTVIFLNTNTGTPYTLNTSNYFLIDSVAVTPKWLNGTKPSAGNANAVDSFTFCIYRGAASYTVFASSSKYA